MKVVIINKLGRLGVKNVTSTTDNDYHVVVHTTQRVHDESIYLSTNYSGDVAVQVICVRV